MSDEELNDGFVPPPTRQQNTVGDGQALPDDLPEFLTTSEVARIMRVTTETVRRWVKSGHLEAVRVPTLGTGNSRYRISTGSFQRFIAANFGPEGDSKTSVVSSIHDDDGSEQESQGAA